MGQISKFSAQQFENLDVNKFKGVTLVYRTTNRDGETHESAVNFEGEEYTPQNKTQNEVFRVWKNVVTTFWSAKILEASLKQDNDGVATKLRSSTPAAIIVNADKGTKAERWDVAASVWQRIGLVPSKKDIESCAKNGFKKQIHKATKASFDALNFRAKFDDSDVPEMERVDIADESATESK